MTPSPPSSRASIFDGLAYTRTWSLACMCGEHDSPGARRMRHTRTTSFSNNSSVPTCRLRSFSVTVASSVSHSITPDWMQYCLNCI